MRDFPRAKAIFPSISRLGSQYRHSHLPNNASAAAVSYNAITVVAANVDIAIAVEFFALLEEVLAEMLTRSHSNSHSHNHSH